MKKVIFIIFLLLNTYINYASVSWGGETCKFVSTAFDICTGNESGYIQISWFADEINNDYFQIWRDDGSGWVCIVGHINGCGTCYNNYYRYDDLGPFAPNTLYHYKVRSVSNWGTLHDNYFGYASIPPSSPLSENWQNQVTSNVEIYSTSDDLNSYSWYEESNTRQGVNISFYNSEDAKLYLEENNFVLCFNLWGGGNNPMFNEIKMNIDNNGLTTVYSGSSRYSYVVPINNTPSLYSLPIGHHTMKVEFSDYNSTYFREYDLYVVAKSSKLFKDNYCNTMRVWEGTDPNNEVPILLSEGFDAYNTKPEQYYREAGDDLINCLQNKGFKIYVLNYRFNSQSIKNNAAVYSAALKYISSINNNKPVIAAGISMGGIIARYALANAEDIGDILPASTLLTLDSPHQGAVISSGLQNFRKINTHEAYAEYASNNPAAMELLTYNSYDPTGTNHNGVHTNFFYDLNHLNGDGYPHSTKNIAVSFSNTTPNPISGKWLHVHVTGLLNTQDHDEYITSEEQVAGSLLPEIDIDPYVAMGWEWWECALLWAVRLNNITPPPYIIITQYQKPQGPTFIPHNSSLDIDANGVSKFHPNIIVPSQTYHHNEVPYEIIEPLVNMLLSENVYVQNKTINSNKNYISGKYLYAGNNVTSNIPTGNVIIIPNTNVSFKAKDQIILKDGFKVQSGAYFNAKIEPYFYCDYVQSYQSRANPQNNDDSLIYNNYELSKLENFGNTDSCTNNKFESLLGERKITVYPNPTTGELRIDITNFNPESKGTITITDMVGKLITEIKNISSSNLVNLSNTARGSYVLKLILDDKSKEWVIVKE